MTVTFHLPRFQRIGYRDVQRLVVVWPKRWFTRTYFVDGVEVR